MWSLQDSYRDRIHTSNTSYFCRVCLNRHTPTSNKHWWTSDPRSHSSHTFDGHKISCKPRRLRSLTYRFSRIWLFSDALVFNFSVSTIFVQVIQKKQLTEHKNQCGRNCSHLPSCRAAREGVLSQTQKTVPGGLSPVSVWLTAGLKGCNLVSGRYAR